MVEYSDAVELPGNGPRFMKRTIDEGGEASDEQETVSELPVGLVRYTKEREDALEQLREALGKLDAKMVELFNGEPDAVGRRLDSLTDGGLMLVGTVSLEKPKKPKRRP